MEQDVLNNNKRCRRADGLSAPVGSIYIGEDGEPWHEADRMRLLSRIAPADAFGLVAHLQKARGVQPIRKSQPPEDRRHQVSDDKYRRRPFWLQILRQLDHVVFLQPIMVYMLVNGVIQQ